MNPPAAPTTPHFRAYARRPVSLQATAVAGGGSWRHPARLVDLGLGGACVELAESVPVGSPVALIIDAPHLWDPLEIHAVVAWVGQAPSGGAAYLGVKFQGSGGALLRTLAELLEAAAYG
jgi:hypothetical protein